MKYGNKLIFRSVSSILFWQNYTIKLNASFNFAICLIKRNIYEKSC
nr:MAG TPA: hypothetical protein [Caudoviricetes sp.]